VLAPQGKNAAALPTVADHPGSCFPPNAAATGERCDLCNQPLERSGFAGLHTAFSSVSICPWKKHNRLLTLSSHVAHDGTSQQQVMS